MISKSEVVLCLLMSLPAATPDSNDSERPPALRIAEEGARHGEQTLVANFRFAPWSNVLKWYADELGLILDLGEVPPGTFNYYDSKELTAIELLDVFNGYLVPKGYLLVQRDNFLVCVNVSQGVPPNLIPHVSLSELPNRGRNELLSVVIPVGGSATALADELEQLLGPYGRIAAIEANHSLAIVDVGANLRRIAAMLDEGNGTGNLAFRAFPLRHISAGQAEQTVRSLFGTDRSRSAGAGRRQLTAAATRSPVNRIVPPRLAVDPRSNQLLVTADPSQLAIIEALLASIDSSGPPQSSEITRILRSSLADAQEFVGLERLLTSVSPRIRVTTNRVDTRSGLIPPPTAREVRLDVPEDSRTRPPN